MTQPQYTPPPYVPAPARKRGMPAWGWAALGGCGCAGFFLIAIFAAILFPVFAKAREKARQSACMSNLKQISIQMLGYAQDNDDKFPPASKWMDTIEPYRSPSKKDDSTYRCPALPEKNADSYGYAYNRSVAGKPTVKITDPQEKMLVYDSETLTRSASDAGTSLSAGRHSYGNNIAFADGHVKWFRVQSGE